MLKNWANANELWADVLAETLRLKGVDYAITCPGSRSSPLTFAFARNEGIEAIPVLDERSAGFFALGLAKRTGKAVALLCTSGSAVANFFPAVVEASESGIPLVLLTADRPAELRDCGAGQTIDQVKLFGGYVRSQSELALPEASLSMLRYLRQRTSNTLDDAFAANRGPVHLNAPFRDPLIPSPQSDFVSPFGSEEEWERFFDGVRESKQMPFPKAKLPDSLWTTEKGLILVGPCSPLDEARWCENLAALSKALGWPVLSDALNPVRSSSDTFESLISGYEYILRSGERAAELEPEHVIVVGSLPTSKTLRNWLERLDLPMTLLVDRSVNLDPTHSKTNRVYVDLEGSGVQTYHQEESDYCERWLELDDLVADALAARLSNCSELFEGKVAWTLASRLPEWSALCVSNSMPPRDMEFYFPKAESPLSVYSSRGANGIDGILSTAMGVAHEGEPSYLLVGDLALLHDTNGALIGKSIKGSLTIVLINNSGGGIFEMLPVSQFADVFEKHYGTDQQVDFANWVKTYGIAYERIESWPQLEDALEDVQEGVRLLEIKTDRKRDAALRKQWFKEIAESLAGEL